MKIAPIIVVVCTLAVGLTIHFFGGQMGRFGFFFEALCPNFISTESWMRCVEENPEAHGYSVWGYLERRKSDAAIPLALKHVKSDDAYLWLNAATYLGSRDREEATPYLIKSIRHTAWRSLDEQVEMLEELTGQNYGQSFRSWKEWYLSTNPEVVPDWDSSLGSRPRLKNVE